MLPTARRLRLLAVLALLASPFALPRPSRAEDQSVEVRIDVPGLGQERASGLYNFKFAIVDTARGDTWWSNDSSSAHGEEPQASVPFFIDNGTVTVVLGEPPQSSLPPLPAELLNREDVFLRIWVGNASTTSFRRLPDRRLRGKGFAFRSESARNADRLEGKRAADFESAGAVERHEERFVHTPAGRVPGGRFYHGSTDLSGGKAIILHFESPEESRLTLALNASALVGPPSLADLEMKTGRIDNQAATTTVDVVNVKGAGWLAGVRESWDFCNTCFKRKLPPETVVLLDGAAWESWKSGRREVPEGAQVGRLDNLLPLGLVRFERSLQIVSRHRGADDATGTTSAWWYAVAAGAGGAPGAVQVLLDGGDVTPSLVGLPEAAASFRVLPGRMVATRYDGFALTPDSLEAGPLLTRPPASTWIARGAAVRGAAAASGSVLLAIGEVQLAAGERRFGLSGASPAALEVLIDGQFRRAVALAAPGQAEAALLVPDAGWHQARLVSSGAHGDLDASFSVDGTAAPVRTTPLLGGEGGAEWSVGPLDLSAAGIGIPAGRHTLTLRERGGRPGHLEYSLLVE